MAMRMTSVAATSDDASIHLVLNAPTIVAGRPLAQLHSTVRRSIIPFRRYASAATRVPGIVAGSGDATAEIAGTPARNNNGVATAEPPLPKRPPRKPTPAPMRAISIHCTPRPHTRTFDRVQV